MSGIDSLKEDRLRLRLEIRAMGHEIDRLRAENDRLRDAFADGECFCSDDGCVDPLPDNCPKLLPEIARLRAENAKLEEITRELAYEAISHVLPAGALLKACQAALRSIVKTKVGA